MEGVGGEGGVEWVVREGVGAGGEMTQALYAHMNNKTIKIKKTKKNFAVLKGNKKDLSF
jgi:NaMN:DMB phosphoribosyltransferase